MFMKHSLVAASSLGLVLMWNASATLASDADAEYPTKPLQFLVAAGAGGGTDNFARTVKPMLEEALDTNVTIINLPAASGALAHQRTASSSPDGHTLDFASSTFVTSLAAGQNPIGLDELTPVARMQSDVMTLIVDPEKYPDFESFLKHAKENPGEVIIGGTHAASPDRMAFLAFRDATGLDMNFIPYDQEGSVSANVMGGNIDGMFGEISSTLGYMESGEMMPILVFAEERLGNFPDIPTTVEHGWDLTDGNERGVFVNADTPPEIVSKIESSLKNVYDSDAYQEYEERVNLHYREGWLGSEAYRQKLEDNYELYKRLLEEN
ncbi:tripartite tricarboxylate transporter substrate binding protein [Halomonas sp. McH1-25]|uniref:tripartite tricarboxylate transporter substrate binding protein n=1 Tax=unclassified Halomonas TaxID=2609666 RepID=UPI001EF52B0F|nr:MULTISPECIES: tripartite tricarboxylate transporter substrate binding protein [unclassified Halomonas]MCG7600130.1 tripartite tricarboxylate transporter substrate binding protein [Halomonas sp. McH1-25]MCP1341379.1 tripartite tricarboxylate transporter substrate binding protein [Halomonas sp. FL8]MCP1359676.1 tripartite tricarboxylate transporter substrate binding protein [Halomonas sp. BBD45]MCP1365851.1 tripartite tricarboxylate transporter substrate binding protein [Halomonas sp. BBD48]